MSIIVRSFLISMKKNFTYPINGIMVIVDTLMDCFALTLFWLSLVEMEASISGWNKQELFVFIGFGLLSMSIYVLFAGAYDIQRHILNGSLDLYLVKPHSAILIILLEKANFLRFLVAFPIGMVLTILFIPNCTFCMYSIALIVCVLGSVLLGLIRVIIYELAFWFKSMNSVYEIYSSILEIKQYPIHVIGKKAGFLLTYIIPVSYVATIPTQILKQEISWRKVGYFLIYIVITFLLHKILWRFGRKYYESAN